MKKTFTLGGVTFDTQFTFWVVFTTTIALLDAYGRRPLGILAYDRFLFYFVLPALIILVLFRQPLTAYGLQWGDWREGLLWVVGVTLVMGVILWLVVRLPNMTGYYSAHAPGGTTTIILRSGVELFAWEFTWRGVLLFGMARVIGPGPAIFLQAVPFAFMHLGKPEIETLTTILGGAGFGFIAWRTRSFLYPWLIHWFMLAFTQLLAVSLVA